MLYKSVKDIIHTVILSIKELRLLLVSDKQLRAAFMAVTVVTALLF